MHFSIVDLLRAEEGCGFLILVCRLLFGLDWIVRVEVCLGHCGQTGALCTLSWEKMRAIIGHSLPYLLRLHLQGCEN